jgi:hypothetical protein
MDDDHWYDYPVHQFIFLVCAFPAVFLLGVLVGWWFS